MFNIPRSCRLLFEKAGWFPGRSENIFVDRLDGLSSKDVGIQLLSEFGGLGVGEVGPGRDYARNDVKFLSKASIDDRYLLDGIRDTEDFFPIAWAHEEYLGVYIDSRGRIFCVDAPTGGLHEAGDCFESGMESLLLGYKMTTIVEGA